MSGVSGTFSYRVSTFTYAWPSWVGEQMYLWTTCTGQAEQLLGRPGA